MAGESRLLRTPPAGRSQQARALFVMVGAAPNSEWLSGLVKLDDKGFVITGSRDGPATSPFSTSQPRIFAVAKK
jgi:thioredoxin reductase (NADPH)